MERKIDQTNEWTAIWGLWYRTPGRCRRTQHSTTCLSVPDVAWDTITSHLIFVFRHPTAPQPIRLQAARTLDDILVIIPRHLYAAPSDLQAAVQRRVLDHVLAQQIMLSGAASSTNMDLRRLGLETLHQILQASGHTLLVGWETIFEVLGSVCRPTPSDPASYLAPPEPQYASRTSDADRLHAGEGLFCVDQDRVPMYDAHMRWPLRAFSGEPEALHQHAWAVRVASGHEYRADGG